MATKIQKYEDAVLKELKNLEDRKLLGTKEDELYCQYNKKCAEKINKFLDGIGSDKRYDSNECSCVENFIVDNFDEGSEEQGKVIAFCENNIISFESRIEIPKSLCLSSYKVFLDLNIPMNLTKGDFSSIEIFKIYKEHVCSATHDND